MTEQRRLIEVRIDTDPLLADKIGPTNPTVQFAAFAYLVSGSGPSERKSMPSRLFWFPSNALATEKVRV